jgi:hypothetical protein
LRKLRSKPNTENPLFSMVCALLVIYFPSNKALCTELYILYIFVADIMFHMLFLKPFDLFLSLIQQSFIWENGNMQPYFSFLVVQIETRCGLGFRVVNFSSYLSYRAGFNNYN